MRKKIINLVCALGPLIGITIVCLYFICRPKPNPEPVKPDKVTDTLYIDKPYKVTLIKRDTLKPEKVVFWKVDSTQIAKYKLRIHNDSITIVGLRDSVRISRIYLETLPRYPKLLGLTLFKDSIDLTTLSTDGVTKTEKYKIQLQDYSYYWTIDGFGYKSISRKKERSNLFSHYIGLHYDFLRKAPLPMYQARINLGRIECNFSASQELYFTEKPEIRVGVNYKLNRK